MPERGSRPRETGLDVLGNRASVARVGSGEDPRGIEETVIWALFRNGLSPGIQGTHFRIREPDFELVGPQLVFLRVNSDCPVPWKNSNSSPIYPLSPQLATSGKGAIPSSGVNALMSQSLL